MSKELIQDIKIRTKIVETWEKRFKEIRDASGLRKTHFCEKYGIKFPWLSKAIHCNPLPRWSSIVKIETLIESEGGKIHDLAREYIKKNFS